jgi:RimJ/RimL family protein N-acetyltransferase
MNELSWTDFGRAQALFAAFDSCTFFRAVAEGNNPGQIFVDDVAHPRIGLAATLEATLLVGDPSYLAGLDVLREFLQQVVFKGQVCFMDTSMTLAVSPAAWVERLPTLIPTHELEPLTHDYYHCHKVTFDWRTCVPHGYEVRRIDRSVLDDSGLQLDEMLSWWPLLETNWHSTADFLEHGAGFCVLHGSQVIARCMADCWAGDHIDLGIVTHPAYRRQGFASLAAAATVEYCLQNGFNTVGWHCLIDNLGSQKTAQKIGFHRATRSTWYYYMLDPVDHLAELGWYYFKRGAVEKTVRYYEQVFARREDNPDYYYHLAAAAWARLGKVDQALQHLHRAVEAGWPGVEDTRQSPAFIILHDHAEWPGLLARMAQNKV